jgi:hypothetical protein
LRNEDGRGEKEEREEYKRDDLLHLIKYKII